MKTMICWIFSSLELDSENEILYHFIFAFNILFFYKISLNFDCFFWK